MSPTAYVGIPLDALENLVRSGADQLGNTMVPFVDEEGGWNLRCCLRDSEVGERIAIIAWSPFPWTSPYSETGPIVVHAQPCRRPHDGRFPSEFDGRRQVVRPYYRTRVLDYERAAIIEAGAGLEDHIDALLLDEELDFVHVRSVVSGCFSFAAYRSP